MFLCIFANVIAYSVMVVEREAYTGSEEEGGTAFGKIEQRVQREMKTT